MATMRVVPVSRPNGPVERVQRALPQARAGAGRRSAAAKFRNDAICGNEPPAFDDRVGEHQSGICERQVVIRHGSGRRKARDIDDLVGKRIANFLLVDDRYNSHATALLFRHEVDHCGTIFAV